MKPNMKIQVTGAAEAARAALHIVLLPEGATPAIGNGKGSALELAARLLRRKEWKAEFRSDLLLYGQEAQDRLLLVGLGPAKEVDAEKLRRAAAVGLARARKLKVKTVGLSLEGAALKSIKPAEAGCALAEGLLLGSYKTPTSAKKPDEKSAGMLTVRLGASRQKEAFAAGVERGRIVAEATNLTRELADLPGNQLTPTILAQKAARMAKAEGLKCRIYRKKDLERMKMGGILEVAKGGVEPPVLIEMIYQPRRFKKTVCLVGKGLTFDSGGISLKPSNKMGDMKYDMCGGGAVIGAMCAVARLKPSVKVIGLVPSSDNMPSGTAQKPGDVLKTASGLTVEVLNTDAEGRLILSDALHHATGFEPDHIIDLATLTGACVVALGHDACGLFSNDEKLSKRLQEAAEVTADRAWPMPLFPEYQEDLKSPVADLANISGGQGPGAGTAAWFLSRFVGECSWAHLDIAGVAYGQRNRDYIGGKGATGAGVRLLAQFIESLS